MENPTFGKKFRALLATGRVANLPTVWSNVLVGFWFGSNLVSYLIYYSVSESLWFYLAQLVFLLISATLIYLAGCMLGDAKDLDFDRKHRPERPLPQGVLSASKITLLSYVMFGLALGLVFVSTYILLLTDWYFRDEKTLGQALATLTNVNSLHTIQPHEIIVAVVLCTCVIIYAHYHKRSRRLGLSLITASRFLLVIFAVAVTHKTFLDPSTGSNDPLQIHFHWLRPWVLYFALAVACHTLLLSWVASTESLPGLFTRRKLLFFLMLLTPLSALVFNQALPQHLNPEEYWGMTPDMEQSIVALSTPDTTVFVLFLLIYYAWLSYAFHGLKTSQPAFVSRALAGFCLLDACFAATYAPALALVCLCLFGLALVLQKVAPAT